MQLTESHGPRQPPDPATRSHPHRYADTTIPAASAPCGANAADFDGSQADEVAASPTHWTRILYHDVMNANIHDMRPQEGTRSTRARHRSSRNRSPVAQGAILLGIYVAMYLVVAAVLHVLPALDGPGRPSIGPHWALAPLMSFDLKG